MLATRLQVRLGRSERRYRNLLRDSPAPINLFDEDGETVWGNDAVLDLLDLDDRGELIDRSIFEFIHPDDHALARAEMETVIEGGGSTGPTSMRLITDDGELRHIQVSTTVGWEAEAHGWEITLTEGSEGGARFEFTGVETA